MNRVFITILLISLSIANSSANDAYIDDRKLYIHHGIDELGSFNWGNFLSCLVTAKFPDDEDPRKLNLATPRMVTTMINDHLWIVSIREDIDQVIIESFTIDTHLYYTPKEKRKIFLRIIGNCELEHLQTDKKPEVSGTP